MLLLSRIFQLTIPFFVWFIWFVVCFFVTHVLRWADFTQLRIESTDMQTIGLIAAMPQESNALLHRIHGWKRIAIGSYTGQSFELSGQTCILVTSGMGIRRAGLAARALVESSPTPQVLISFGIAGAVEADLQIGDGIAAASVCQLEPGSLRPGPLQPLAAWPPAALEAAAQALSLHGGARLLTGTAVTTGGPQASLSQLEHLPHPVLEMETAGIAHVAAEHSVPLLSLRAISDSSRAPLPFDLGEMMDAGANLRAGQLLKTILRHPGILFQFSRLTRNTRLAADNAAIALIAALSQANL
jgi:adenosylhomocysteine nucleosidase